MRSAFSLVFLLVLTAVGFAQAPQQAPQQAPDQPLATLKLGTRLVAVQAVVLDERGEPVRGLTRDDFTLKQDGKPQPIRYFSQDSTLPLTLALLVDTSSSQRMFLEDEIRASERFYRVMLTRPADRASLLQFDDAVLERQPMTSQLQTLENTLNFLSLGHAPNPSPHGGTLLYEAVVTAAQSFRGDQPGRRAMVLLTDGEDNGSRATLEQAIAAAERSDVVVYSVLYSMAESGFGPRRPGYQAGYPPPHSQHGQGHEFDPLTGREALTSLSNATGGRVFTVSARMPLDLIFVQIADALRLQYQIGYTPPESKPGAFHKIELKSSQKHMAVQARHGYYSP
jgi:Ca-activated chloride channel family protein